MADLLLELYSEEIPACMQVAAREQLQRMVKMRLEVEGLGYGDVRSYVTPRRLAVSVADLAGVAPAVRQERRGPRVDAPNKAIEGFLRSTGLMRKQLEVREGPKGPVYFAVIERAVRPAAKVIAEMVPEIIHGFDWPKSMVWTKSAIKSGECLKWVRPLRGVLCILNGQPISFEVEGLTSDSATVGHRFMAPASISVKSVAEWQKKLEISFVMVEVEARRKHILKQARALAEGKSCRLVDNERLLDEVVGLVEWPVVLIGSIDETYMRLPKEILVNVMEKHQKYMVVSVPETGELAPYFIVVSNLETSDKGATVVKGNERVLRARLEDARFAFERDKSRTPQELREHLKMLDFYPGLGSLYDKTRRMISLARVVGNSVGLAGSQAMIAARYAKLDLVSSTVEEFPSLQGVMGGILMSNWGESDLLATAIREHYKPLNPRDGIPTTLLGQIIALADKLDTLFKFQSINEMPTGSGDPNGLRRATLGIIRIMLEGEEALSKLSLRGLSAQYDGVDENKVLDFIYDRLKIHLRGQGFRHDIIDSVFTSNFEDSIASCVERIKVLSVFLKTEDGESLLAIYRRAINILTIEEKKDKTRYDSEPNSALFSEQAEYDLDQQVTQLASDIGSGKGFEEDVWSLAKLRSPVDNFFANVMVNASEKNIRENRLRLLAQIRSILDRVADFSRLELHS
ncbi:MAG: glycine--tRNA ligase subunit beta [Parvularculales bacterium]